MTALTVKYSPEKAARNSDTLTSSRETLPRWGTWEVASRPVQDSWVCWSMISDPKTSRKTNTAAVTGRTCAPRWSWPRILASGPVPDGVHKPVGVDGGAA